MSQLIMMIVVLTSMDMSTSAGTTSLPLMITTSQSGSAHELLATSSTITTKPVQFILTAICVTTTRVLRIIPIAIGCKQKKPTSHTSLMSVTKMKCGTTGTDGRNSW